MTDPSIEIILDVRRGNSVADIAAATGEGNWRKNIVLWAERQRDNSHVSSQRNVQKSRQDKIRFEGPWQTVRFKTYALTAMPCYYYWQILVRQNAGAHRNEGFWRVGSIRKVEAQSNRIWGFRGASPWEGIHQRSGLLCPSLWCKQEGRFIRWLRRLAASWKRM